jgi:tryptophan synthase alpha chain
VTGERAELATTAVAMATRLKKITDIPVLVGVGISNAEQAMQACAVADGVIQGASVVRRLLEDGPDSVATYVAQVRAAIDSPIVSNR